MWRWIVGLWLRHTPQKPITDRARLLPDHTSPWRRKRKRPHVQGEAVVGYTFENDKQKRDAMAQEEPRRFPHDPRLTGYRQEPDPITHAERMKNKAEKNRG